MFVSQKGKYILEENQNNINAMEKKEALYLEKKMRDIQYRHLEHFLLRVKDDQRSLAHLLMINQVSDEFFNRTGYEEEELDVALHNLQLDKDEEYQDIQKDY